MFTKEKKVELLGMIEKLDGHCAGSAAEYAEAGKVDAKTMAQAVRWDLQQMRECIEAIGTDEADKLQQFAGEVAGMELEKTELAPSENPVVDFAANLMAEGATAGFILFRDKLLKKICESFGIPAPMLEQDQA